MPVAMKPVVPPTMVLQGTVQSTFTYILFYTTTASTLVPIFCFETIVTNIYMFNINTHSNSIIHAKSKINKC